MYRDRTHAGQALADAVVDKDLPDPVVLGLPRGGVPVAAEVAERLGAPLDVVVVRKLGVPGHEELGMGAIAEGGAMELNQALVRRVGISASEIERVRDSEEAELQRRVDRYRQVERVDLAGRDAVIVDDGLATGFTARAAVASARADGAASVVLAVPVAPPEAVRDLEMVADEVICPSQPRNFFAVGQWYQDFRQTTDEEVVALLS